jgi:hypothetical protein
MYDVAGSSVSFFVRFGHLSTMLTIIYQEYDPPYVLSPTILIAQGLKNCAILPESRVDTLLSRNHCTDLLGSAVIVQ